tara:strand:+ start:9833 stop:10123 length:291 start_codon:yes stop_codon:yes gene_type:complete
LKEQKINPLFKGLSMKLDSEFYDEKTGEYYYRCGKESAFKTGSKWIKTFNLIRSNIAHLGSISKANGVNKEELKKLKLIYNGLIKINYKENYEAFK